MPQDQEVQVGPDETMGRVWVNITVSPRVRRSYPDPLFTPLEFTAAEARKVAAELCKAADELDAFDRSVEEYFRTHPEFANGSIDIPF